MSDKVDKVERMPYVILLALNKTKRIDMKISVDITGIANCPVRDANGNLLASVWTRNSVCNEFENATLLSREALEKHLKIFIDEGVKQNLAILPQVQDPAMVVDWVVKTAEFWERRYAEKRNEKYDISQNVLSVMFEVVFDTVAVVLQDYNFESFQQKLEERTKERSESMQENKYYRYIVTQFGKDMSADEINLETFFSYTEVIMLWYVFSFAMTWCQVLESACAYWQANYYKKKRCATKQGCTAPAYSAVTSFKNIFTLSEIFKIGVQAKRRLSSKSWKKQSTATNCYFR